MPWYVPLLFMAVPLAIVGVWLLVARAHRRVGRAMRTVPNGWVRAPWPGPETTFRSSLYGTFMPRPGARVEVFHDPIDPARARIAPDSIPATFRRLSAVVWVVVVLVLVPLTAAFELIGWFLLTHR